MPQSIHFGKYFDIWEVEEIQGAIQNEKYKIICINDTDEDGKFSECDQKYIKHFSPNSRKSSFWIVNLQIDNKNMFRSKKIMKVLKITLIISLINY